MPTAIGLAMQITASSAGAAKGLSDTERLIRSLGRGAEAASKDFDKFRDASGNLPPALQAVVDRAWELTSNFRAAIPTADEFRAGMESITNDAESLSAAFKRGAAVTADYTSEEEKAAAAIKELQSLLDVGAISQETFARGMHELTGAAAAEKDAEEARVKALEDAEKAQQATADAAARYATEEEKAAKEIQTVQELYAAGAISSEAYSQALHELTGAAEAEREAEKERNKALADAASITNSVLTPEEKHLQQMERLNEHLSAGRITQDTFNKAADKSRQSLDGAAKSTETASKEMTALEKSVKGVHGTLKLLAGLEVTRTLISGFNAVKGIFQSVSNEVNRITSRIDHMGDVANRTGIGVEALQSLNVAGSLSGIENLDQSLQKLQVSIGKAAGEEKGAEKFAKLGLELAQLQALSPEEQFRAVSAAISKLPTQAERAAAAVELFGKSGTQLLPLFNENLGEIEARSKRLGIVLSGEQVDAIDQMNDTLGLVSQTFDGIIGQVIGNLAPIVTEITENFLKFVENFEGFESTGGTGVAEVITYALLDAADYLAGIFDYFYNNLSGFGDYFAGTVTTLQNIGTAFYAVGEVFRGLFNGFEIAVNTLGYGLGKFLEGIGSWVSSDLEKFGADLAKVSGDAMTKNADEMAGAFSNAAGAVMGDKVAKRAEAQGPAGAMVAAGREAFTNRNSPEAMAEREAKAQQKLFDRLNNMFVGTGAKVEEIFGDKVPQSVLDAQEAVKKELDAAWADGVINEEEQRKIADAQGRYNKAISEGEKVLKEEEKNQKKRDELLEKFSEKQAEIESERVEGLSKISTEALKVSDVRTSEGASELIRLATGREDPAVEEYKKQLRELQKITKEISKIGTTVEIAA